MVLAYEMHDLACFVKQHVEAECAEYLSNHLGVIGEDIERLQDALTAEWLQFDAIGRDTPMTESLGELLYMQLKRVFSALRQAQLAF